MRARRRTPTHAAFVALACGLTAATVAIALTGAEPEQRTVAVIAYGLLVAVPTGVGLGVLARRPGDRFARLLVAAGVLWAVTVLVQAEDPLLYSVGRVAVWLAEGATVYLLLA